MDSQDVPYKEYRNGNQHQMCIEKVEIRSPSLQFRDKAFTFRCLKDVTALMLPYDPFQCSTLLRSAVNTHLPALVQH